MADKVVTDLLRGQACLFGGVLTCVVIKPRGLGANNGICYYGVHWQTLIPYAVALLGSAYFIRKALVAAAGAFPDPVYMRRMAAGLAVTTSGLVVTPYSLGRLFDMTHTILGAVLFVLQLILAARLLRWVSGGFLSLFLVLLQLTGGVIAAIYVLPKQGFLIQGQLLFQLAFGALLVRSTYFLPSAVPAISAELEPGTSGNAI
jgi:hypothetical protein